MTDGAANPGAGVPYGRGAKQRQSARCSMASALLFSYGLFRVHCCLALCRDALSWCTDMMQFHGQCASSFLTFGPFALLFGALS